MPSRNAARRALEEGRVVVTGLPEPKASSMVSPDTSIRLEESQRFVSRGGDKLDSALARFSVAVAGRRWLDAGASTGGFTDRLLEGGATAVIAVDVGYGQFDWRLRNDPRVSLLERTNVRHLTERDLPFLADAVVADLSFISLRVVLPALVALAAPEADHLLLVKPQFEVGREAIGRGGVVRDPHHWRAALDGVVEEAEGLGLGLIEACLAEPAGPAGNREFFVHLKRGEDRNVDSLDSAIEAAGA